MKLKSYLRNSLTGPGFTNCVQASYVDNPKIERSEFDQFLAEFRFAGLRWVHAAGMAGAGIYATLLFVSIFREGFSPSVDIARASIVVVLLLATSVVANFDVSRGRIYPLFVGCASVLALFGTVFIAFLSRDQWSATTLSVPVSLTFGLFLHYCFLRLPLFVASSIGWAVMGWF